MEELAADRDHFEQTDPRQTASSAVFDLVCLKFAE